MVACLEYGLGVGVTISGMLGASVSGTDTSVSAMGSKYPGNSPTWYVLVEIVDLETPSPGKKPGPTNDWLTVLRKRIRNPHKFGS